MCPHLQWGRAENAPNRGSNSRLMGERGPWLRNSGLTCSESIVAKIFTLFAKYVVLWGGSRFVAPIPSIRITRWFLILQYIYSTYNTYIRIMSQRGHLHNRVQFPMKPKQNSTVKRRIDLSSLPAFVKCFSITCLYNWADLWKGAISG